MRHNSGKMAYLFLLPVLFFVFGFALYPLGRAVWMGFTRYHLLKPATRAFVGLGNFKELFFEDRIFWQALSNSTVWVVGTVAMIIVVGLAFALLLNLPGKGIGFFRACMLIPWVLPTVVVSLIWSVLFWQDYGLINLFLKNIGLIKLPINWLGNPKLVLFSLMIVFSWWRIPFATLMLLAGLQTIDKGLYEVAQIDGASKIQQFRYVTIPLLVPVIEVVVLISIIWAFNHFDIAWVLTGGGPVNYSTLLSINVYRNSFSYLKMGYASAIGDVMLVISLVIGIMYVRSTLRRVIK